ncbi:MAG TPA: glycerol-3-phosphate dehydrogenase/oxidase, partial [Actinomycetota bacterium]|nr:glycerol-3-phosphate dehydrogenase/oxidase [Actinomycetota bacterium]
MLEWSAATRERDLTAMADRRLDVLVIGGGITGAGIALDAASRGLSIALVERDDFAAGTSGRSSRLIHGGVRYLRHGEFGLVYESLRERATLRRLAPHLVRPLGFLVPTPEPSARMMTGIGLTLYDAVAVGRTVARHRRASPDEMRHLAPTLRHASGGYLSFDCRTDDARLTLEILRQAVRHGALVANHAEVEAVLGQGRITGARVLDRITGRRLEIRAEATINATGVWADAVCGLAFPSRSRLRPSKGVHVVIDRERLPIRSAVLFRSLAETSDFAFAIPWGPRVYVGTTDTPYDGPLAEPRVEPQEVQLLLASLERAFEGDVGAAPVRASWAG